MAPQDRETAVWFEKEVQPHESGLRAYLHGIARSSDIDDLVQETYSRLLKVRENGQIRSARGLLFATARNASRDLFRRRGVAKTFAITEMDDLRVLDDAPGQLEVVSREQENEMLAAAIDALPERCRMVLILRKFENLSHAEIASRMGITVHTVESQLTKALHRCQDYFEKEGALPPR